MIRNSKIHAKAYFYLIVILAAALPLSIFATSLLQILLMLNWIIEGDFRQKWLRLTKDRAFLYYLLFYFLHLIGLFWSKDLGYGFTDLKLKLPLLVIPLIIASSEEFSSKQLRIVLIAFIAGVLAASFASILALLNIVHVDLSDFRNASLFVGHIRFSLMIVLSILFATYMFFRLPREESIYLKIFLGIAILWLPVFLIILKSLSGLVIILVLIFVLALRLVKSIPDRAGRFMLNVFIIFIPLFAIVYIGNSINRFYTFDQNQAEDLDSLTVAGNKYINHINNKETENGHYVWIHICPEELEKEWGERSDYDYMGKTENGDFLRFTLIRYLTSKGLRKDSAGLSQLTRTDIEAIEEGIANHIYLNRFALYPRIYQVIWEFDRYKLGYNPNDKSLIQRYFYLKAGASIARENLLFGVGTGDVRQSFEDFYKNTDSPLRMERRRRAHNQYLTLAVAFGIPGFIVCMLAFILPVFIRKRWNSFMVIVFLITMALSMLDEDTLENTPGAVMFGLFYGLFVFGRNWDWKRRIET